MLTQRGRGATGTVTVGWFGNRKVAIKIANQPHSAADLVEETKLIQLAGRHPNIVQLVFLEKGPVTKLYLQLLGPNLAQLLQSGSEHITIPAFDKMSSSVLRGRAHLT